MLAQSGGAGTSNGDFRNTFTRGCRKSEKAQPIADAAENGYPTRVWLLDCPKNRLSGRPKITLFKAVQGNDGFYLVQEGLPFRAEQEQATQWMGYLRKVSVCDSRIADRACPKTTD